MPKLNEAGIVLGMRPVIRKYCCGHEEYHSRGWIYDADAVGSPCPFMPFYEFVGYECPRCRVFLHPELWEREKRDILLNDESYERYLKEGDNHGGNE